MTVSAFTWYFEGPLWWARRTGYRLPKGIPLGCRFPRDTLGFLQHGGGMSPASRSLWQRITAGEGALALSVVSPFSIAHPWGFVTCSPQPPTPRLVNIAILFWNAYQKGEPVATDGEMQSNKDSWPLAFYPTNAKTDCILCQILF